MVGLTLHLEAGDVDFMRGPARLDGGRHQGIEQIGTGLGTVVQSGTPFGGSLHNTTRQTVRRRPGGSEFLGMCLEEAPTSQAARPGAGPCDYAGPALMGEPA